MLRLLLGEQALDQEDPGPASVTYIVPVIALIWGVVDGEDVGVTHVFGMAAILLGVYLVNRKGSPAERIRKNTA